MNVAANRNPLRRFVPYWSAMPAIATSLWLMHIAGVPRTALGLQVLATAFAALVLLILRRRPVRCRPEWLAFVLALCLFAPLLAGTPDSPQRWIFLGGIRLYVAPIVLPATLLLLEGALARAPALYASSVIAAALALVLQPDASQASAFALGLLAFLVPGSRIAFHAALLAVALACAAAAWHLPDPLSPVRHVEGIFGLAAELSPITLAAAMASAGLLCGALAWRAWRSRSPGTWAVAIYYAALFVQAPLQVTPVPLLGFGAGPILGYFLVAGMVSGRDQAAEKARSA